MGSLFMAAKQINKIVILSKFSKNKKFYSPTDPQLNILYSLSFLLCSYLNTFTRNLSEIITIFEI